MACHDPVLKPPSEPRSAGPLEVPSDFCAARENMEFECPLPNGDVGWCSGVEGVTTGKCKAICPAGYSYTNTDTMCHQRCGPKCKVCSGASPGFPASCSDTPSVTPQL